jgi:hypothetical protein
MWFAIRIAASDAARLGLAQANISEKSCLLPLPNGRYELATPPAKTSLRWSRNISENCCARAIFSSRSSTVPKRSPEVST